VSLYLPTNPKPPAKHLPEGVPQVKDLVPAKWWLTDRIGNIGIGRFTYRALIVHDVMAFDSSLDMPEESFSSLAVETFSQYCCSADLVITVSNTTRRNLLSLVPELNPKRVCIVTHGLARVFS
jgi:hypothetical protein